jgi:hypothetical protein
MPEFKITHYDIYKCHSFVNAESKALALSKFNDDDGVDGPDPIEWYDRYSDYKTTIEELT